MLIFLTTSHWWKPTFHVLVLVGTTHDHVTLDGIVNAKNAVKLGDLVSICMEIDESLVTLIEVVDLIGELAPTPILDVIPLAAIIGDGNIDTLHNASADLIGG